MEEKIKTLRLIVGEMAEAIWAVPQSQWFDWALRHMEFVQSEIAGDMVQYTFHHNGYSENLEPFRMVVLIDPYNWFYQEATIRGIKSQLEVDLF